MYFPRKRFLRNYKVIIIKLGTVTASGDNALHVNCIDLDLDSRLQILIMNKCSINSETKQRERTLTVAAQPAVNNYKHARLNSVYRTLTLKTFYSLTILFKILDHRQSQPLLCVSNMQCTYKFIWKIDVASQNSGLVCIIHISSGNDIDRGRRCWSAFHAACTVTRFIPCCCKSDIF